MPSWKTHLAQCAGKAQPVQKAERERHDPRRSPTLRALPQVDDLDGDEHDAQCDHRLDRRGRHVHVSQRRQCALCATVNAVTVFTSSHVPRVMMSSASTNNRWSMPSRMCSTPSLR